MRLLLSVIFLFTLTIMVSGQIYVDASNIDGDDDGTAWATAYRYLQDAISVSSSGN